MGKQKTKLAQSPDEKVLMTFQIEESKREAANAKATKTSINLSEFLRQCVYEFLESEDIGRTTKALHKQVTKDALSKATLS